MTAIPAILIFDIGKTNKKALLFSPTYELLYETSSLIPEVLDEDGFPCEDLSELVKWIRKIFDQLMSDPHWDIYAMNFSTYGASLVHLDKQGRPVTALYNYLKPIDPVIIETFYAQFGDRTLFSLQTGSPALGMLNSGLQLYWLKHRKPLIFKSIHTSLHLPQYLHFLFTGKLRADISSIGCHTGLWDIYQRKYHDWTHWEGVGDKLPAALPVGFSEPIQYEDRTLSIGIGLHDSTASLLPYTIRSGNRIAILSTGTWNIFLLPSYQGTLNEEDYQRDCLYFLLDIEQPVAAARIFLGNELEAQLKKLNQYFNTSDPPPADESIDMAAVDHFCRQHMTPPFVPETMHGSGPSPSVKGNGFNPAMFGNYEEAYRQLIWDIARLQKTSMDILLEKSSVNTVHVTGGFAKNKLFMRMMQNLYPDIDFHSSVIKNGSALGAAMAMGNKAV